MHPTCPDGQSVEGAATEAEDPGPAEGGDGASSTRTVIHAGRSASLSVALTSCSMSTGQRCLTSPGSARSSPRRSSARSATRVGSPARPSSPVGAAPARSRCHPAKATTNRFATGSISAATAASTACCTSSASFNNATIPPRVAISHARPQKARLDEKPDAPTNASSRTASSAACGAMNTLVAVDSRRQLDKGASDSPDRAGVEVDAVLVPHDVRSRRGAASSVLESPAIAMPVWSLPTMRWPSVAHQHSAAAAGVRS